MPPPPHTNVELNRKQADFSPWRIETNAVEWALLIANATGEYEFAKNWSAAVSLHYSALNYFSARRKFRTFIIRPEIRYWFNEQHRGVFLDAHIQSASFNFALESWQYRIHDTGGKHPAIGGGFGIGYRTPISKDGLWCMQAQMGIGIYRLKYDRFENRINGAYVDTRTRSFFGIDNVALSIVYRFKSSRQ